MSGHFEAEEICFNKGIQGRSNSQSIGFRIVKFMSLKMRSLQMDSIKVHVAKETNMARRIFRHCLVELL